MSLFSWIVCVALFVDGSYIARDSDIFDILPQDLGLAGKSVKAICGEQVHNWLDGWQEQAELYFSNDITAEWNYNVDITDDNEALVGLNDGAFKAWTKVRTEQGKEMFGELVQICKNNLNDPNCCLTDQDGSAAEHGFQPWTRETSLRALNKILTYKVYGEKDMDASSLGEKSLKTYQDTLSYMVRTYSTTKIASMNGTHLLSLEPEIYEIMAEQSRMPSAESYEIQKYYWANWNKVVGRECKSSYSEFVEVSNEAAKLNGYTDTGDSWRDWYEDPKFEELVDTIWNDLKPLYSKLHGHVRHILSQRYGPDLVSNGTDPIPAHLLGNMWAQDWGEIYSLLEPYPDAGERPDATPELEKLTIREMYDLADEFYQSLGLYPMTDIFWDKSVFEKKTDTDMVCHASAWDFMAGSGRQGDGMNGDYRIKQCTVLTQSNFVTLHHEMGHIEYFQQYAHQPIIFRTGANPGFHEAIGDTIALAVSTPAHLNKVNLLPDWTEEGESDESDLNYLMMTALDKITFLPFGLMMDKYRWKVFRGEAGPDGYQELWDQLRLEYQGLVPPVERTTDDFDPAAKFHTSNNVPYIRYFVSFVIQFQFYEKMCITAKQYDPEDPSSKLYKCDFFQNLEAGELMENMLVEGNSRNWQDVLKEFLCGSDDTCDGQLSGKSLKKYFAPLDKWLDEQAAELNYKQEWSVESKWTPTGYNQFPEESAVSSICGNGVHDWLDGWHSEAEIYFRQAIVAEWNYNVDITDAHEEANTKADAEFKAWTKVMTEEAKGLFRNLVNVCKEDMDHRSCCLVDQQRDSIVHGFQPWTRERQLRALDKILTYKVYGEKDMDASALEEESFKIYQSTIGQMVRTYSTTKVVKQDGSKELSLEPDIYEALAEASRNPSVESYETQKYYWANWNKKVGRECKNSFEQFVTVSNEAAVLNGYNDTGDSWRAWYDDPDFEELVEGIWAGLKPLYGKLHGHVRHILGEHYGDEYVGDGSSWYPNPIPAHILGDMWAQQWSEIYPLVEPFPDAGVRPDATPELEKLSVLRMYELADEFYQSLGLFNMTDDFWKESVFEKKTDAEMVCHASAWDFMGGDGRSDDGENGDYRIKQCTAKTQSNFITIHHEMGHIEYYQQYAHQPIIFRSGANPGFHEAVGDTIALAVATPAHLNKVDLLPDWSADDESEETDINFLMMTALDKITFLPFALLMDKYRWKVFREEVGPSQYQALWDQLRLEYQGVVSPVARTAEDFDPAAKFHTSNNVPYIRYFVSFIIQFQFYEKMCIVAGEYDPTDTSSKLYKCDFFENKDAGAIMEKMLMEGNGRKWQDVLKEFLCTEDDDSCVGELSGDSMKKYFKPLEEWLDTQSVKLGYPQEWDAASVWKPLGYNNFPQEAELGEVSSASTFKMSTLTFMCAISILFIF